MVHLFYQGLIIRIVGAAVMSFLIVIAMGPSMIRFLIRRKLGDRPEFDHADLNRLARHKSKTPTMGGILIVIAIFVSVLVFANLRNMYILMGLVALVWLGVLGGIDDWIKLSPRLGDTSRDGLKMYQKLLFQIGLAVLLAVYMRVYGSRSVVISETGILVNPAHSFSLPFSDQTIPLSMLAYTIITVVTMVGSSNAVNLTDGMDGLAPGCVMICSGVFLLLAEIVGVTDWATLFNYIPVAGSAEMTVLCAAMFGSCLGFLWYNASPAEVFMGDTGSLPLGGLLGYVAVVTRMELLLVLAGGVFVIETLSVVLQVGYSKMTKKKGELRGKYLFRAAPIHHHFHLAGWAETKVVTRFWIVAVVFGALALATLKLR